MLAAESFRFKVAVASGSGPAGQLKLNRDGKCLAELSAADVAIETCNSGPAQRGTSYGALHDLGDGRCLADAGVRNGVRATAAVCRTTSNKTGSVVTPAKVALGAVTLRDCTGRAQQAVTLAIPASAGG